MKFLLSKKRRDKSHILDEFNSAMMVTRYDDIMAHNRLKVLTKQDEQYYVGFRVPPLLFVCNFHAFVMKTCRCETVNSTPQSECGWSLLDKLDCMHHFYQLMYYMSCLSFHSVFFNLKTC